VPDDVSDDLPGDPAGPPQGGGFDPATFLLGATLAAAQLVDGLRSWAAHPTVDGTADDDPEADTDPDTDPEVDTDPEAQAATAAPDDGALPHDPPRATCEACPLCRLVSALHRVDPALLAVLSTGVGSFVGLGREALGQLLRSAGQWTEAWSDQWGGGDTPPDPMSSASPDDPS
jgi:hypothetical protein